MRVLLVWLVVTISSSPTVGSGLHAVFAAYRLALGLIAPPDLDERAHDTPAPRSPFVDHLLAAAQAELAEHPRDATLALDRAELLVAQDEPDAAEPAIASIVEANPPVEDAIGERAGLLWLWLDLRARRYQAMLDLTDRLWADPPFLAHKPELLKEVSAIHGMRARHRTSAAALTREEFRACGTRALAIATVPLAGASFDPAPAYLAAGTCFDRAGDTSRAIAALDAIIVQHPGSALTAQALANRFGLEVRLGKIADALATADELAARHPVDHARYDVISEAIAVRLAVGDLAGARRDADLALDAHGAGEQAIALAEALLATGDRAAARGRALAIRRRSVDPVRLATVMLAIACPVALVDELCPAARDPVLTTAAREVLANERSAAAHRMLLDLALERARPDTYPDLAAGYEALLHTPDEPLVAVIAEARLGQLARRAGDDRLARHELAACVGDAQAAQLDAAWLALCERALEAMDAPLLPLNEVLPRPAS